ncbi:Fc.00g001850.m01.CDS01 [Cosmosporella sp. VM-42]
MVEAWRMAGTGTFPRFIPRPVVPAIASAISAPVALQPAIAAGIAQIKETLSELSAKEDASQRQKQAFSDDLKKLCERALLE